MLPVILLLLQVPVKAPTPWGTSPTLPPGTLKVAYQHKKQQVSIKAPISTCRMGETYRMKTSFGAATVQGDPVTFPLYKGFDTGPMGLALSLTSPEKVAFDIEIGKEPSIQTLSFMVVDGRKIDLKSKPSNTHHFRLAGGSHFIKIAWEPVE